MWSDGGPQLYGTQEAIAFCCGSEKKRAFWHFEESGHGKGPPDGWSAVMNGHNRRYVTSMTPGSGDERIIRTPQDIANVCNTRMAHVAHAEVLTCQEIREFAPRGVHGLFGIRRFKEWLSVPEVPVPPKYAGAIGCREFGGRGPVYVQFYKYDSFMLMTHHDACKTTHGSSSRTHRDSTTKKHHDSSAVHNVIHPVCGSTKTHRDMTHRHSSKTQHGSPIMHPCHTITTP